ncbi:sensor histidine kinase [Bacillus benzoevorans]|uniref:histidine kinase n=1 Tax=Bacillus benzoevorans TaxID=1456 RepID=A0A7X0HMW2_9BACI|nr:HAMP domain-containing sensor histidine kinase [Bacillus benzoevorans]MBB6443649.1 signal transduction histidine kinase [Bacillus benzoevorans]
MFKSVKRKLTLLFSLTLLCLLLIFIVTLYFLISSVIERNEQNQLYSFFTANNHAFINHLKNETNQGLIRSEHGSEIFYYVFDKRHDLYSGLESAPFSMDRLREDERITESSTITTTMEWKGYHFLLFKRPLQEKGILYGYAIIGKNVTEQIHVIQTITWIMVLLTVLFSLAFAFLGYYFAGQAMKPIKQAFDSQRKFISDASHELRTPLSIFYSSIDLLERDEKEHLSEFGREVVSDLKEETISMKELVNDLLFLARSDQSQIQLQRENIDLSQLLASISKRFSSIMPDSIQFQQNIESGVSFHCDKERVQQLIYILLDNAIHYTDSGSITLTLKKVSDRIMISVRDTGCGIKQEQLPYIFDRFFRSDSSRHRNGSGLGLSIAKAITDMHKGIIAVESSLGKGTAFTITFQTKSSN